MTAVVEIAKVRRKRLAVEIGRLDVFVRMAEALIKYSQGLDRVSVVDANSPAPTSLLADSNHDAGRCAAGTVFRNHWPGPR